jgi:WD40 repeat protein
VEVEGAGEVKPPAITDLPPTGPTLPPIGPGALVPTPAAIKGVTSWTLETRTHRWQVIDAEFSPDGERLAILARDGSLRIWSTAGQGRLDTIIPNLPLPENYVHVRKSLAWSPDGARIAYHAGLGRLFCWNTKTGKKQWSLDQSSAVESHGALAWSPDGKSLALGRGAYGLILDADTGQKLLELVRGDKTNFENAAISWSHDSTRVAASSSRDYPFEPEARFRIWDAATGELVLDEPRGGNYLVPWSPDDKHVISVSGKMFVVNSSTGEATVELPPTRHRGVAWLAGAKQIAIGENIYDLKGNRVAAVSLPLENADVSAWSPGAKLAAIIRDGRIEIYDAAAAKRRWTIVGHSIAESGASAAMSPDGTRLVAADAMWELPRGEFLVPAPPPFTYTSFGLSPHGRYVLYWFSTGGKARIGLYDQTNKKMNADFAPTMGETPFEWAWSPDETLIVAHEEGKLVARKIPSGDLAVEFEGSDATCRNPAFSPDGKLLAAFAPESGKIRFWSTESGKVDGEPVEIPCGFGGAWSPDGKYLAVPQTETFVFVDVAKRTVGHTVALGDAKIFGLQGHLAWNADSRRVQYASSSSIVTLEVGRDKPIAMSKMPFGGNLVANGELALSPREPARLWDVKNERPGGTLLQLARGGGVVIGPNGHYRANAIAERELVYVVETPEEVKTLTASEFEKQYGWQNDPKQARLLERK